MLKSVKTCYRLSPLIKLTPFTMSTTALLCKTADLNYKYSFCFDFVFVKKSEFKLNLLLLFRV